MAMLHPPTTSGLPCPPMVTHADGTLGHSFEACEPGRRTDRLGDWSRRDQSSGDHRPAVDHGFAPGTNDWGSISITRSTRSQPNRVLRSSRRRRLRPCTPVSLRDSWGCIKPISSLPPGPSNGIALNLRNFFRPGTNAVQADLTVSFGGTYSFDGAGICVATRSPGLMTVTA